MSRFFCRTLSISSHVIADAVKHRDSLGQYSKEQDPCGRRVPPNKTSPEMVEAVKKHIASFPSMESHKKKHKKEVETQIFRLWAYIKQNVRSLCRRI